ncbi:cysteine hydrolase [Oligoflexaceae bacterium]|nr:cysteine hydrolase [Oligoflexaceae bacterium]
MRYILLLMSVAFLLPSRSDAQQEKRSFAVLIVDMQYGFYERGDVEKSKELSALVRNQTELLTFAVQQKIPIIFLEYAGFGKTDTKLLKAVEGARVEHIKKDRDSGFSNSELESSLHSLGVDTIIVAGINGCCCIFNTALDATDAGFDVYTSPDLIGNLNHNPPRFPDRSWVFESSNLFMFDSYLFILKNIASGSI